MKKAEKTAEKKEKKENKRTTTLNASTHRINDLRVQNVWRSVGRGKRRVVESTGERRRRYATRRRGWKWRKGRKRVRVTRESRRIKAILVVTLTLRVSNLFRPVWEVAAMNCYYVFVLCFFCRGIYNVVS